MILQSLHEYYQRKMVDPDPRNRLPAFGLENKEIPFIVEIAKDGTLLGIKDTRRMEGKKARAEIFLVPKGAKRSSGVTANLLWDTAAYALGIDGKGKPERIDQQVQAFRARIEALPVAAKEGAGVTAVLAFLDSNPRAALQKSEHFVEIHDANPVVAFRLDGDGDLVCQHIGVPDAGMRDVLDADDARLQCCLVTGALAQSEKLHAAIKGVWGAQTSGGNIVSFNQEAFTSFGKEQGDNAPISVAAAFAYTTALNHLLARDSRQRIQVGDASTVFWAQSPDPLEDQFGGIFGESDAPDRTEELRALLEAVRAGRFSSARGDNPFFVLGLAPNAARISIRFWQAAPLRDIAQRTLEWFEDIKVVRAPHDHEFPSLFRLLNACALQNKADNVPPSLGGDIMRAILSGGPFPASWLNAAVQRCRAERNVTYLRAAAIKACLNRSSLYSSNRKEWKPMLDTTNSNPGYRLGRLFAALEKLQEEASPGLNATIRDRYYGAASSTPVAVFTTLLRLKNHHIGKLDGRGRAVNFEKMFGEIMAGVTDFPLHLSLPDQGRFALGYYHQRQAFFTKQNDLSIQE
jgi:CRISPR-associated protein Csd1